MTLAGDPAPTRAAAPPSRLRPEAELLLAAASPQGNGRFRSALDRGDLDWDWLTESALKNRVVPAVCGGLKGAGEERLLATELDRLGESHRRTQFENLGFLREMLTVVELLEAKGIAASPYKGPVLAAQLYEDHGHREYHDLDLLVKEADLVAAREVLAARGYVVDQDLGDRATRRHVAMDCELRYRRPDADIVLELHWEILPRQHRRGFDIGDAWQRLVPLQLGGRTLQVLGNEDLLLVLCIHGGEKHQWGRLQMVADVARLMEQEIDWDVVFRRARAIGREPTVLLGLLLAWVLLDAPLDEALLRRASAPRYLGQAALAVERLFRLDSGLPSFSEWQRNLAYLVERAAARGHRPPEVPGRVRYLAAVLTPDWTDRQALAIPAGLGFLYWVWRPLRLLRRHGTGLFRRI